MYDNEVYCIFQVYIRQVSEDGRTRFELEKLTSILNREDYHVQSFAYAVQEDDVHLHINRVMAPERSGSIVIPAHIRLFLRLGSQYPQCDATIAKWFGVSEEDVFPFRGCWHNAVLALTCEGDPAKGKFSAEGITANFDVQSAIDYAIELKKLEYIFGRMLYGNDRRMLPCSEVERIRNRLLTKTQPFFDSPYGKAELDDWIFESVFGGVI